MARLARLLDFSIRRLRRPRTLAWVGFTAVAAGIAANALFLQAGPHPAPFFFTRARPALGPNRPDELVRAVQDALMQVGYYSGPLDGLAGPQTRSAIEAFEEQSGREKTGRASLALLAEVRSSSRPDLSPVATRVVSPAALPAPRPVQLAIASSTPTGDAMVAAVQDALARSAYGPLVADGVAGPDTRAAIMRFQSDHHLPVTGEVSDGLVVELRAVGALGG